MRWLKLTVAYDGTDFAGWQIQPDKRTVQGTFEAAWRQITQEDVRVTAAGRTDAGVHALGQVVGVASESRLSMEDLHLALNAVLPEDVSVLTVEPAREGFHATHDALGKTYRYQIHNGRVQNVFDRRYAWHYPERLDAARMESAGQALVGRHDFSSFETAGSERPDSVRTIHELKVARGWLGSSFSAPPVKTERQGDKETGRQGAQDGPRVTLEISGDGFLYKMVRVIVGTLVEVGRGERSAAWPAEVLAARDRRQAGQTAPPQGLFLVSVEYRPM